MQWSLGHHRIVAVDIQPWKPDDCPYAKTTTDTERRLWNAADSFRANSSLKSSEYSVPVLGMIFLRYADFKFAQAEKELAAKGSGRRVIGKEDYQRRGVLYLPPAARYAKLLAMPEGENVGKAVNEAMKAIEADNEELKGVLPKSYTRLGNDLLISLIKNFSQIEFSGNRRANRTT